MDSECNLICNQVRLSSGLLYMGGGYLVVIYLQLEISIEPCVFYNVVPFQLIMEKKSPNFIASPIFPELEDNPFFVRTWKMGFVRGHY